jgi:hypothetical protein
VAGGTRIRSRHLATAGRSFREARRFQRFLHVHSVIDDVGNELRVRQRLHRAAHDAEADVLVALFHEGRNDGVEGALAAGENVG